MFIRNKGIATQPGWPFIGLMVTALLLAACVITFLLTLTPAPDEPPPTATPEPATSTPEPPTAVSSSGGGQSGAISFIDEIFPPGHQRERDLVIFTCGNCHTWVCALRGQRPVEHWRTVKATHKGLFPALSDEQLELLFDFLAENFNDTTPEPDLPAELQTLGCTRPYP